MHLIKNDILPQIKINIWCHTKNWFAKSDLYESEFLPSIHTYILDCFLPSFMPLLYNTRLLIVVKTISQY